MQTIEIYINRPDVTSPHPVYLGNVK